MDIFLIRYTVGESHILHKSVVKADFYEEALCFLLARYKEYNIKINIEEYEIVTDNGIILTWHEPVR